MCAKFHQDLWRGLDFHWPSTYKQTDRQTSVRPFLYIDIWEDRRLPGAHYVGKGAK